MFQGIRSSVDGMQNQKTMQEVLADNLANVNTSGYKSGRLVQKIKAETNVYDKISNQVLGSLPSGAEIYNTVFNMEQGALRQTGNPLDLAVSGEGFFAVQDNQGRVAYTRNGHFAVDQEGYLVNQSGDLVLDSSYAPIYIGIVDWNSINVLYNGDIVVNNNYLTTIKPFEFKPKTALIKQAGDKFVLAENAAGPDLSNKSVLKQGFIEGSNVSAVKASTEMIQISRTYEANHNALKAQFDSLNTLMNIMDSL